MNIINKIKNDYEVIINKDYMHVINYLKVNDIKYNKIMISLIDKNFIINGDNLIIKKLNEKELIICGSFKGLDFVEK